MLGTIFYFQIIVPYIPNTIEIAVTIDTKLTHNKILRSIANIFTNNNG